MSTHDDAIERTARKLLDKGTGADGNTNPLLTDTEIGEEVDAAVTQYSLDRPRVVVVDVTGVTSPFYAHATLTGWVTHWSRLLSVEPQAAAVSATYTPSLIASLDDDVEQDYQDGTTHYVWLRANTPVAADIVRFRYTAPHTLTNSLDTIPSPHFDAVCDLAASYCCKRLATKYSAASDSTIQADSVNYRDGQLRMKQSGDEFYRSYVRKVALPEDGPAPASVVGDWDTMNAWGGDRLFHGRRHR